VRAGRIDERGRDKGEDEGGESPEARDERELGFGMGERPSTAPTSASTTPTAWRRSAPGFGPC